MTHRHKLRESPVRGDTPAGFGGRAGETYREQSRQRAPVRPYSSPHSTIACADGSRDNPTTSRTLASSSGSVENLKASVCQGLPSCLAHPRATVLWLIPSWSASSRRDQWVTPSASVRSCGS